MRESFETIKSGIVGFETSNQIGILTLDNGNQNKISKADFVDLSALKKWICQSDLKGLIVTSKGRHFSVGADVENIRNIRSNPDLLIESLRKGKEILSYIETLPLITVAAISGVCFGAGLEIALSCQFRIIAENSILAFPESGIGIMPGLAGTIRLPRIVGRSKAIEILVSGRTISANEAYDLGLCNKVVAKNQHLLSSIEFIEELSKNKSQEQIERIIKSVNNSFSISEIEAMEEEGRMFVELVKNL